ncbi:DNA replication protein DnaC [Staphylococcus felis]|uniref:ATP-binding protein n=1 Tax=Staphylococcus felis TaxID=46127 RepID=UPI000E261F7F|nr:ATP-binding protein [Staphylococcus felis]REH95139.1 DNA replication protein DnaC [Staphylococcus felis]REI04044.1 DNA replication protein DnaC [Staphylococcus felis]REI19602.1 DNA replication protein DnaC [Staphylococcus felis]REI32745.1 DNA replication protein DnaC [Staphylococcus felis]
MNPFEKIAERIQFKNEIVEKKTGLHCDKCGRDYDWYKFDNGYEYKDGCDCELIEMGKEATNKRKQQRIDDIFNQSTVNPSIKNATVNNYEVNNDSQKYAKQTAIDYVTNFSNKKGEMKSILFRGSYGTGKSHLAYAIAKAIKNKGYTVAFMQIPDLMIRIKATYNKTSSETFEDLKKQLVKLDLLVLDDIGVSNSDHDLSMLYDIINNRQDKNNIFTTNFKDSELNQDMHWHRINSRMKKGSRKVNVIGDDYRERDAW